MLRWPGYLDIPAILLGKREPEQLPYMGTMTDFIAVDTDPAPNPFPDCTGVA